LPELLLFDFLVWSGNFKGSLKKENKVPRAFLLGLFIWPNWELEDQTFQAIFCTLATAIVSPRSLELKQEAKEPLMEEAMRCELKLPVKRTARIHCGGRVPTGAIASRNPVEGEKVPTPVRRSARIQGMKQKDYKEVSPEPKDYGGSDYSDDRSPSSWAAAGRDDNGLYIWDEVTKEKIPEGLNGGGDDNGGGDGNGGGDDGGDDGADNGDDDPFGLHPMCCRACRQSIADLYASVDECLQAMEAMKQCMEDLERVVEDDYKFLNRNVRKLFGMVGNMRGKWCNTCLKYH
jgi:hypothetical protein